MAKEGSSNLKRLFSDSTLSSPERNESISLNEERLLGKIRDTIRHTLEKHQGKDDKGKEKVGNELCERKSRILRKYGAAEFTGSGYPVAALVWIQGMEKVFRITRVGNEDKADFASSMFTERARIWWDTIYESLGEHIRNDMKWEFFKVLFLEQYCPLSVRMQLEEEFPELRQGPMLLSGYETQMSQKVQSPMRNIPTSEEAIRLCVESLREEIRSFRANSKVPSFSKTEELVEEHVHNLDVHVAQTSIPKRPRVDQATSTSLVQPSQNILCKQTPFQNISLDNRCSGKNRSSDRKRNPEPMKCHGCGDIGHIRSRCPYKNVKCHTCGTEGHIKRQCSTAPKQSTGSRIIVQPSILGASAVVKKEEM